MISRWGSRTQAGKVRSAILTHSCIIITNICRPRIRRRQSEKMSEISLNLTFHLRAPISIWARSSLNTFTLKLTGKCKILRTLVLLERKFFTINRRAYLCQTIPFSNSLRTVALPERCYLNQGKNSQLIELLKRLFAKISDLTQLWLWMLLITNIKMIKTRHSLSGSTKRNTGTEIQFWMQRLTSTITIK